MLSHLAVFIYRFVHGQLKRRGGGWVLRRFLPFAPGLRCYPIVIPEVGVATIDFRDATSYSVINYALGDHGNELDLFPAMERFFRGGDVLWDIGANAGMVAAHFSQRRFQAAAVECFEPNPIALKVLRSLFEGSRLVQVHPVALGARDDTISMRFLPGNSNLSSFVTDLPGMFETTVQVRSGDALVEEGAARPPTMIKIDAEGYEPQVLEGLTRAIETHRPVIFYEDSFASSCGVKVPPGYRKYLVGRGGTLLPSTDSPVTPDSVLVPDARC